MTFINASDDRFIEHLVDLKIFDGMGKKALASLTPFIRHMALSVLDYMTVRDLAAYGGCRGDMPLILVLMGMFAGLQDGSLCLNLDREPFLAHLPADERSRADAVFGDFLAGLAAGRYRRLITTAADDYMPLVLDGSSGRKLLYFQKYFIHEKRLKARMESFLNAAAPEALPDRRMDAIIDGIYAHGTAIRVGPDHTPIARDPQQVAAAKLALTSPFSIISGGPGTGKTSLMVNILRCLVRTGIPVSRIMLGAPTGRAAQRMTETVQTSIASIREPAAEDAALLELKGSTLHKLLGYRGRTHDFYFQETQPLPASVVVVDEVSMVDVVMLDRFLQAVDPARTRLILLGDKNQLPSVEAGAVFAEMIPDGTRGARFQDRFVVLGKVYRSGTRLLELADQVNRGAMPPVEAVAFDKGLSQGPDRWAFVHARRFGPWQEQLCRWADARYLGPASGSDATYASLVESAGKMTADALVSSGPGRSVLDRLFSIVEWARILSVLRSGMYGCTVINAVIADHLIRRLDPSAQRRAEGFSGALVIITRNDYAKALFNGDVGVIIKDAQNTYRAFFHRSGAYVSFPVNLLAAWEFAFAMTVHKSQGSEFDDVLLVLPDDPDHRLLTREIVYTGITRAKKRVIIYGSPEALHTALQRKIQRQSGLMW